MNAQQLLDGFNNAGIDTPEKLTAFLRPSAIAAQLADYDGRLAELSKRRGKALSDLQAEQESLVAEREEVRRKLEGEEK